MTHDYNQILAHLAIMFSYLTLLKRSVEWGIDLTTADVNATAPTELEIRFVEPILDAGAPRNVLDVLFFGGGGGKEGNAPCTVAPRGAVCGTSR